ncbi:hypothetical protein SAMN04515647_1632 [Cohaesibacter sp. ES.047]|nr:hypothetical protein [Cohaesibacter sp. ES.047]SNY91411.1 hypothetical protein SAMN04515647_1632 [Cohaesibacter sp. ES.047]
MMKRSKTAEARMSEAALTIMIVALLLVCSILIGVGWSALQFIQWVGWV